MPPVNCAGGLLRIVQRQGRGTLRTCPALDDDNLLYRIDRVHLNTVEALPPFVVPALLAMMVGVRPVTLATLVWVYVAIRLTHVAVYLRGGNAAKGGSIRTVLYVSGALVTIVLIAVATVAAIH